jgi:hemin uptake protein HemP
MMAPPETQEREPSLEVPSTISTDELFRGRRELVIRHGELEYRLRITRAGKLILTK